MKATNLTRQAADSVDVRRDGEGGVTYKCLKCGLIQEANAYYEADHEAMMAHAAQCDGNAKWRDQAGTGEERTVTWQLKELRRLVEPAFVKTAKEVKGAYTTGDYVTYLLNRIFSPAKWSFTILRGPDVITLNEQNAYAQVVGRLEVTFADGSTAHQDDVGIWPLVATGARRGGTLEETAPERFETVCKAARTDCLKNASYNLGTCFAPLSDGALVGFLQREEARQSLPKLNESAAKSAADLFGIAQAREDEVVSREAAHNAERLVSIASDFDDVVAKYKDGELELPPWVKEIRDAVEAHPQASDALAAGNDSFIRQLEISAGRKVTVEQFRAFVEIVLTHPLDDVTFGEAAVLMDAINGKDFEAQIVALFS